jgi:hypothetical protein
MFYVFILWHYHNFIKINFYTFLNIINNIKILIIYHYSNNTQSNITWHVYKGVPNYIP